ncbi:hypothetical protein JOD02_000798 [Caldicoprobacter guelmensis]|nr:hypothetical protein [Caldicoprobacter guelmensis]
MFCFFFLGDKQSNLVLSKSSSVISRLISLIKLCHRLGLLDKFLVCTTMKLTPANKPRLTGENIPTLLKEAGQVRKLYIFVMMLGDSRAHIYGIYKPLQYPYFHLLPHSRI